MKKFVVLLIFPLLVYQNAQAKKPLSIIADTIGCDAQILEEYNAFLDTIDAFFTRVKSEFSAEILKQLVRDLKSDNPENAFGQFGSRQNELRNKFIEIHNNVANKTNFLRQVIYSANPEMSDIEKFELVKSKIECHIDNMSNSRFAPPEIGSGPGEGPCDNEYGRCKRSAKRARNAGFWNCTFGGLGLAVISGGLGLGVGVSCHAQNVADYNQAVDDCTDAYHDCLGLPSN